MRLHLILPLILLPLLAPVAAAQELDSPPEEVAAPTSPAWLPRSALLGVSAQGRAVVAQGRVQWQLPFLAQGGDTLAVVVEGGGGPAVVLPATLVEGLEVPIRSYSAYTAQVGVGYHNQARSGFFWGFQLTSGPVFYGARYSVEGAERSEALVAGLLEGRLLVGYRLAPVVLGVAAGYAEPYSYRRRNVSLEFLGGPLVGLFLDWRLGGP